MKWLNYFTPFAKLQNMNPFIPNGTSHHYQLEESISRLRVVGSNCIQILKVQSVNSAEPDQTLVLRC